MNPFYPPINYIPNWLGQEDADIAFKELWDKLDWVKTGKPRREYYCNDVKAPYVYDKGPDAHVYWPQPMTLIIRGIRVLLEEITNERFEVCFLNGYVDGKDQLGWHSDDSPEMDDDRPIAIVTLGEEREIWFRSRKEYVELIAKQAEFFDEKQHEELARQSVEVTKLTLGHGSLCLMQPGMQDTHQHRIPKSSKHNCGPRISLTFRGYVDPRIQDRTNMERQKVSPNISLPD